MDARRTKTCIAPSHVDASLDALLAICSFCFFVVRAMCFILFHFSVAVRAAGGGGGRVTFQTFLFVLFSLFGRPRAGLPTVYK